VDHGARGPSLQGEILRGPWKGVVSNHPYVYLSEEAFPEGIVKLMDHEPTAPQYIVIMTSSEYTIL
jgi:hypothetical protein